MKRIRIDQAFSYEPATVHEYGFSVSKEKGTPYVWIEFIFDQLKGDAGEDITVRADLYLSDSAVEYSLEKLANLGWVGMDITELDTVSGTFNLVGKKALISGDIEEYNGKRYPKVNFINDPNAPMRVPSMEANELSVLNGKLRGKIAAYRAKQQANGAGKDNFVRDANGKVLF